MDQIIVILLAIIIKRGLFCSWNRWWLVRSESHSTTVWSWACIPSCSAQAGWCTWTCRSLDTHPHGIDCNRFVFRRALANYNYQIRVVISVWRKSHMQLEFGWARVSAACDAPWSLFSSVSPPPFAYYERVVQLCWCFAGLNLNKALSNE